MKSNDTLSLLDIIKRDLAEARGLLFESAFTGHKLLAEQACELRDLPLATLLLVSASLGEYRSKELKPVAVGLEMLCLAVEKHYRTTANDSFARNLFLVTADYFYAQAISLAARLKKGFVIEHMVKAIADIAEVESSHDESTVNDDKRASLFKTAANLGIKLGGCPSGLADALAGFASLLGRVPQNRERAAGVLKLLPVAQGHLLENLLTVQFC